MANIILIPLPKITVTHDEDAQSISIKLNGKEVASGDHDRLGWTGMEALEKMADRIQSELEELAKKSATQRSKEKK